MLNVEIGDFNNAGINSQYCRQGHGFLLMCALDDRKSFEELDAFIAQVDREKDYIDYRLLPMILVVTKSDLIQQRQISDSEIKEFAERHSLPYVMTSAKMGTNCNDVIPLMIDVIKYRLMPKEIVEKVGQGLSVTGYVGDGKKKCIVS